MLTPSSSWSSETSLTSYSSFACLLLLVFLLLLLHNRIVFLAVVLLVLILVFFVLFVFFLPIVAVSCYCYHWLLRNLLILLIPLLDMDHGAIENECGYCVLGGTGLNVTEGLNTCDECGEDTSCIGCDGEPNRYVYVQLNNWVIHISSKFDVFCFFVTQ